MLYILNGFKCFVSSLLWIRPIFQGHFNTNSHPICEQLAVSISIIRWIRWNKNENKNVILVICSMITFTLLQSNSLTAWYSNAIELISSNSFDWEFDWIGSNIGKMCHQTHQIPRQNAIERITNWILVEINDISQ